MNTVLLIIIAIFLAKLVFPIGKTIEEKILFAGLFALCILIYLVSLIPFALWPLIIWLRS